MLKLEATQFSRTWVNFFLASFISNLCFFRICFCFKRLLSNKHKAAGEEERIFEIKLIGLFALASSKMVLGLKSGSARPTTSKGK